MSLLHDRPLAQPDAGSTADPPKRPGAPAGPAVHRNGHLAPTATDVDQAGSTVVDAEGVWPHTNRILPWLVAVFLTMLWLVPFDSLRAPFSIGVDSKLDRLVLAVMVLIWLVLAAAGGKNGPRFRSTRFNLALLLFVTLAVASDAARLGILGNLGEDQLAAKKLALLFAYVTFFYFVATVLRPAEVPNFLKFMVGLACLTALGTLWEYRTGAHPFYDWSHTIFSGFTLTPPPGFAKFGRDSVVGPTSAPLADATMLSIALPFALVFMFNAKERKEKIRWYIATGLLLAGTFATLRKTAVFIPAAALLTLLAYSPRRMLRFLPALLVLIASIQFLAPHAISSIRYQFANFNNNDSTQGRTSDYPAVTPDILAHPVLGRGYGTYDHHRYRILDNQYLLLLIETGIVGLASFVVMLLTGAGIAHRVIRSRDPVRGPPALALMAAIAGFGVACFMFDALSFPQAPYLLLFVLALIVVASDSRKYHARDARPRSAPARA